MGIDYWNHARFLPHKVRNMLRRGWLLKTYNDKKLLRGRVKTAEYIENDKLDIIHPAGFVAHVKATEKTEIFTQDIGGDPSRRVISMVIGDRENHPQPDENEAFYYSPADKKQFLRIKQKRDQQQQGRADGKDSSGNKDSGRVTGMHWDQVEEKVTGKTKASFANQADAGQGFSTAKGNFTIDAGQNTQFKASKHVRQGETHRDGQMFVKGIVHATDHYAGGSTNIQARSAAPMTRATNGQGQGDQLGLDIPTEDGTSEWQAEGQPGTTSLLQTAAKVGTMGGMMGSINGILGMMGGMMGGGGGSQQQQEDLQRKLRELEEQLQYLQSQP